VGYGTSRSRPSRPDAWRPPTSVAVEMGLGLLQQSELHAPEDVAARAVRDPRGFAQSQVLALWLPRRLPVGAVLARYPGGLRTVPSGSGPVHSTAPRNVSPSCQGSCAYLSREWALPLGHVGSRHLCRIQPRLDLVQRFRPLRRQEHDHLCQCLVILLIDPASQFPAPPCGARAVRCSAWCPRMLFGQHSKK